MLLTTYNVNPCSNATAASTLSTLTNCSASIGEGCRVPPLDTATLASCQASLQAVEDKSDECYELLTKTNAVSCRSFGSFGFLLMYKFKKVKKKCRNFHTFLTTPPPKKVWKYGTPSKVEKTCISNTTFESVKVLECVGVLEYL